MTSTNTTMTEFDNIYLDEELGTHLHTFTIEHRDQIQTGQVYGLVVGNTRIVNAYGKDGKTYVSLSLLQALQRDPHTAPSLNDSIQFHGRTNSPNPNPNTMH